MTSQPSASSSAASTRPATTAATTLHDELAAEDVPNIIDPNRWFFDKEKLESTPSRRCGVDPDKELAYRQQSANFIQDMGQRLQVNQLCINTAIVYMHRFFMFHSFNQFNRNHVSTASIFLAAKVEEQPRKLEHVIKVAHFCLNRDNLPPIDVKSDAYLEQTSELVITENILLQTLGFDVAIDHPHTHVVKCCQLVRASKDLAQTSYFMATNSLHLTTMCLQYKPTVVACVCIHLTCKWSSWEIPRSKEGRDWFWYVDDTVTMDQLEKLTTEFLAIFDKSPSRLKKKILSLNQAGSGGSALSLSSFPTLNMDPHSPGTPQYSSSSLGKRSTSSSSSVKPHQAQLNNKSAKLNLVNGGLGHHPSKASQSHGPATVQPSSSNSVSKHPPHYSSVKGIPPVGSHHSAKEAHIQHGKPTATGKPTGNQHHHHHHSSSGLGQQPQQFPPLHGTGGSNRPSSHSHPSGQHSHASLSGPPPPKPQSSSSASFHSSSHAMVGQHPSSKSQPQHTQPSKPPYNYKSQQQQQQSLLPPPSSQPPGGNSHSLGKSSSLSSLNLPPPPPPLLTPLSSSSKLPSKLPPGPPFNLKLPYSDVPRRENTSTGDFNGKRESIDELSRRNATINSQPSSRTRIGDKSGEMFGGSSSTLPSVTLPFNPMSTDPSRPCRTSSLFSPEMSDNNSISSSIHPIVKNELSPIGDIMGIGGAKGGFGDYLDNPFTSMSAPSTASSAAFPNLLNYEFGQSSSSNSSGNIGRGVGSGSELNFMTSMKIEPEVSGNGHSMGPEISSDQLSSMLSQPVLHPPANLLTTMTTSLNQTTYSSSQQQHMAVDSKRPLAVEDVSTGEEPPHKKSKKSKKEKHKHKDKEKHDKDSSKKHKDKSKEKGSSSKEEKKHKKEKHRDKDKSKDKLKIQSQPEAPTAATSPGGYTDMSKNRIKFTITGSTPPTTMMVQGDAPLQHEKSKSKHSSKKHTSKSKTSSSSVAPTPPLKLKIVPLRPPQ